MEKYIQRISGEIPNTHKTVNINVNGKNLIITGANGSGKTSFLKGLFNKTDLFIIQKQLANLPKIKVDYENSKNHWDTKTQKGTSDYDTYRRLVEQNKKKLNEITQGILLEIPQNLDFSSRYDDKTAVIKFFEAKRLSNITPAENASGLTTEQDKQKITQPSQNIGTNLEKHLVNLEVRHSLAITKENNHALAEKIKTWFTHFENNLKVLMEDDSTKLSFDSNSLKFSIHQDNKPPYTFQNLSSGYSAIFDIYADLMMRTEYFNVTPEEIKGVVFIDEIDAHLHVSLQRLILPFLTESFPSIQFIVTTHSPFVLTSVNDAVVFDVGKCQQVDDDLSLYSYSAVMEGLLGVKTTSKVLDDIIKEIAQLSNNRPIDYLKLKELVHKVKPIEDKLDNQSKAFYMIGVNTLLDGENE